MGLFRKTFPEKLEKMYGYTVAQEFVKIGFTTIEYFSVLAANGASDDKKTMWFVSAQMYARKCLPKEVEPMFVSYLANPGAVAEVKKYCEKNREKFIVKEMIERYESMYNS